ncbi:uncharacterized protein LOC144448663 [Glandiceps talaboti]
MKEKEKKKVMMEEEEEEDDDDEDNNGDDSGGDDDGVDGQEEDEEEREKEEKLTQAEMKFAIELFVVLVAITQGTDAESNNKFFIFSKSKTQAQAAAICERKGYRLVRDASDEIHAALLKQITAEGKKGESFYIDGKNVNGVPQYLDGEVMTYTHFASGQPDQLNQCFYLWSAVNYNWDDHYCTDERGFICEKVVANKWRDDLRCGPNYPLADGSPAQCDPDAIYPCCSTADWCGNTPAHCTCVGCIDYRVEGTWTHCVFEAAGAVSTEVTSEL